jgi:isopenicillin N synthase-like dioxygenase
MPIVPTIDLDNCSGATPPDEVVAQVAHAAEHFGFFQVVNHGISEELIGDVWDATVKFFSQPQADKRKLNRSKINTRGYYDRELTKNARDLKEVLDLAQVRYPELPDDHASNVHAVDGQNQWPELVNFRPTIVSYLEECNDVALWLLAAFCEGLGEHSQTLRSAFGPGHTSFLRMNHYPVDDLLSDVEAAEVTGLGDMALQHHSDAGALALLLQDDVGGLQVAHDGCWLDVDPTPGAIVVTTGDMMQVWSNDRYQAALHRVLPRSNRERYSLPYFFNPSYETRYSPLAGSILDGDRPHYSSINWGDFRQARADGDFADYGAEVQISDFAI